MPTTRSKKAVESLLVGGDESGSPMVARPQDVVEYSDTSGASTPAGMTASAEDIRLSSMSTPDGTASESTSSADNSRSNSPEVQRTRTTITTSTTSGTDDGTGRQIATTVQYSGAAAVSSDVSKDGTLHIHPIPSRKDRKVKVKKVISFVPRTSHFDRFHPTSQGDPFRGFYVLFWLMMGLTMSRVLYHGYLRSGEVVGMRFAKLISEDAIVLGISDGILVGSTFLSVPFMKVGYGFGRCFQVRVATCHADARSSPTCSLYKKDGYATIILVLSSNMSVNAYSCSLPFDGPSIGTGTGCKGMLSSAAVPCVILKLKVCS